MASENPLSLEALRNLTSIDDDLLNSLRKSHGKRLEKALETIEQERVHKYIFEPSNRIVWIVTGNERDYWIIPDIYCNCNDFYINVVSKGKYDACYHLLAKVLAVLRNEFKTWKLSDGRYLNLMNEWKSL